VVISPLEGMPSFRASFPLVEAKLQPLVPGRGTVDRARLVDLLTDVEGPAIVSVTAPPGYGKTTLLGQWAAVERRPVAWLTLDDLDNDPAILVSYLAAALDRIHPLDPSIGAGLSGPSQRVVATAVPRLLSELHRWRRPAVLVLDDAHRLVEQASLDAVAALIEHLPPRFRLALAGRTEPALPFARLRAQRNLLEIGQRLLALEEHETAALAAAGGRRLDPEEVRALTERTEGWPTAVYLATLAGDDRDPDDAPIMGVSGGDRYIAAYLRSEFGRGLDDEDVRFLTRTSILERIEPPLAEAVTGLPGAAERLGALAGRNLLIQPVGRSASSYRYHLLLRDYLKVELERREPGTERALHRRAAAAYMQAGSADRAIEHATASGDMDVAALFVTRAAVATFRTGQLITLERWLSRFEDGQFERHPPLAVIAGWIHLVTGRSEAADRMGDLVERARFDGVPADGSASFESGRAMLRAMMGRNGPRDVLSNASFAVSREGPESVWRSTALYLLGAAHLMLSDPEAAEAAFEEATLAPVEAPAARMSAFAGWAKVRIASGDWAAAERLLGDAQAELEQAHYEGMALALMVYALGARLAIHRGDVAAAKEDLVRAQLVRPLATHVAPWSSVDALLELARAYLAISDPAGAQMVLREAEQIVRRRPALGVLTNELVDMRRRLAGAASTLAGSSTLTAGELRVLPFLPTYLSFQDIADRLMISRNTVKTHAMSIYGKLWASSRGEAVERAVELGLLEPYPALLPAGASRHAGGDSSPDEVA
jgi:LuxR family transcriptional regulator, maltose regulon positive regulatory protein